jgi:O-antigen ligase
LNLERGATEEASIERPTPNIQRRISTWMRWAASAFLLGAARVMGLGLVKSYSRGAWVGAAAGLAYLGYQAVRGNREIREIYESRRGESLGSASARPWVRAVVRNPVKILLVVVSLGVMAFWSFRGTERVVARRALSVVNANDFSWRKRVAAWEGALQMMADRPWFGFGWNKPGPAYDLYYRAAGADEEGAFQMNDFLVLGTTIGLPALVCFAVYLGLALQHLRFANYHERPQVSGPRTLDIGRWTLGSRAICRAGAVVLLVGFWFDSGLFKRATGATFWVLLELGREE